MSYYYVEVERELHYIFFFFSSRRRHTILQGDWSSDVCSSDLSMPYFSIASRSMPMPNANPLTFFGSYPTNPYTAGSTIPAPNNSIHPAPLHLPQVPDAVVPLPPQNTHDTSNSTDGSVNGK